MFTIIGNPAVATGIFEPSQWAVAHATFYGDESASATIGMYVISYQFLTAS